MGTSTREEDKSYKMQITSVLSGMGFGNLGVKVRGVTKYHLSPFEQRAFAGMISTSVGNALRRCRSSFFTVVPPFVVSYLIFDAAEKEHNRLSRKQPGQFDHEV